MAPVLPQPTNDEFEARRRRLLVRCRWHEQRAPAATPSLESKPRHITDGSVNKEIDSKALALITATNAQNSPLLRLPAELRNRIFELAITCEDVIYLVYHVEAIHKPFGSGLISSLLRSRSNVKDILHAFCLPNVCRQIHFETKNLAYSLNVFIADCAPPWTGQLYGGTMWMFVNKRIPAQRDRLMAQAYISDQTHRTFRDVIPHHYTDFFGRNLRDRVLIRED